ncbi:MAG: nucleotidyltransferase family protein [Thermodesulfobacteriota bacterium]|nr:nucleotidyltransferase family protein [Thermodesulfobacteriota bacterium]
MDNDQHNTGGSFRGHELSTFLWGEVQRLHPGLEFCGERRNALFHVSEDLLGYVLSVLRDDPVPPPKASEAEWLELLSVLTPHFIVPILYWHCDSLPPEFLPPEEVVKEMRRAFVWSRARALFMDRQLQEILGAFEKGGVPVLVLKGPALARTVYPHSAMRPSLDLDLLVRQEEVTRSRAILEDLGYRCLWRMFDVFKAYNYHEIFMFDKSPRVKRMVELHWELHPFFGIRREVGVEELFGGAVKVETPSLTFWALNPVDALIHRAVNNIFSHDREMRLSWIYETGLVARNLVPPDDWVALQERSVLWGARLAVENSLKMAQLWVGLQLPRGFEGFSAWAQPMEEEVDAWFHLMGRHSKVTSLLKLRMPRASGPLEKVGFVVRAIFPPPDYMRRVYAPSNDWRLTLAYVRRLLVGVLKLFR